MEKCTLITGASSGMGACCAKILSSTRRLIIASENLEMLQKALQECQYPERHILWHCDFASQRNDVYDSLLRVLHDNDVCVDEYVHFAGMTQILPLKNFTIPYVDKIFNVNFFSIIEILRVLLKKINCNALEKVVLISAMVSQRGDVGNSIYAASKGAINSLVYSLSQELAPKVRINAIMPGAIMTPMAEKASPEHIEKLQRETPLGLGYPQDVVNYVEFLLSDKSRWITGQTVFIDGGRSTK